MTHPFSVRYAPWLVPVAMMLAACNGTAPKASQAIKLSVTTRSASATPLPPAPGVSAAIQIGSSLTITGVQIVLSRIELSPSGNCATTGEEDECEELEVGPTLVTLPVDGTTHVILDAAVPPGTYNGLHARLDAVTPDDDEDGASAFLKANPGFQGISVKVTGTFPDASTPFTFTSEADAEIEAHFQPPVTVDGSTKNLTFDVDIASWFTDATGAVIDPTKPANAEAIEHNIQQSFKVFEDDDHDGVEDQHGNEGP